MVLKYYALTDYVFRRFIEYNNINRYIVHKKNSRLSQPCVMYNYIKLK